MSKVLNITNKEGINETRGIFKFNEYPFLRERNLKDLNTIPLGWFCENVYYQSIVLKLLG